MAFDTTISRTLMVFLILFTMVACNSADGEFVLPTRVSIPTEPPTAEVTETVLAEATELVETVGPMMTETRQSTTTPTPYLPFPTVDPTVGVEIIDPFTGAFDGGYEDIQAGEIVAIRGVIVIDSDETTVFVVNDQEQRIIVLIDLSIVAPLLGHQVYISGLLQNTAIRADVSYAIIPERLVDLQVDIGSPVDIHNPYIPDAESLSEIAEQIGTLDMNLGPNLTALAAYDGLISALGDKLGDLKWIELAGNSTKGWTIVFYEEANDVTFSYVVDSVGNVEALGAQSATPFYTVDFVLNRSSIVVDSEYVMELIAIEDHPFPIANAILSLTAVAKQRFLWTIRGLNIDPIDATIRRDGVE